MSSPTDAGAAGRHQRRDDGAARWSTVGAYHGHGQLGCAVAVGCAAAAGGRGHRRVAQPVLLVPLGQRAARPAGAAPVSAIPRAVLGEALREAVGGGILRAAVLTTFALEWAFTLDE